MANYYGSLDLTELGNIVRNHPELVQEVQMRDGTTHKFIKIDVREKETPDQYGNSASIKVTCKTEERKEGVKYYISNLKQSKFGGLQPQPTSVLGQPQQPAEVAKQPTDIDPGLPF